MDDLGLFVRGSVFQRINICIFSQFVLKWNHKQEGKFKRMLNLIEHVLNKGIISFQRITQNLLRKITSETQQKT
jgi:hypothetical protein